jgi:hypothetical protein
MKRAKLVSRKYLLLGVFRCYARPVEIHGIEGVQRWLDDIKTRKGRTDDLDR